ncbi:MAG: hypothetical protein CL608_26510 [Anaerolineaceae bacterium]|nr:hypothetical protein [Anaerolineaceae bacterium]
MQKYPSTTPEPVVPTDIPPTVVAATAAPTNTTPPMAILATDTAVPTSEPTETAVPPTSPPSAEPESVNGLGQLRESWEQEHTLSLDSNPLYGYDDNDFLIVYRDGRIGHFERLYDQDFSLNDARALSQQYIPTDSEFLETYSPPGFPELIVDLYKSQLLEDLFEDDAFIEGEPGQFIVIYFEYDGVVSMFTII